LWKRPTCFTHHAWFKCVLHNYFKLLRPRQLVINSSGSLDNSSSSFDLTLRFSMYLHIN
jgi:hypothetical protein